MKKLLVCIAVAFAVSVAQAGEGKRCDANKAACAKDKAACPIAAKTACAEKAKVASKDKSECCGEKVAKKVLMSPRGAEMAKR